MYWTQRECDYCGQLCSRGDKDSFLPLLLTPGLPFVKEFVCQNCWDKINGGMQELIEKMISERTDSDEDLQDPV